MTEERRCIIKKDDNSYGLWEIIESSSDLTTLSDDEFDHRV